VQPAGKPISLGELASKLGCSIEGDADHTLLGVASLDAAGPGDLAFARSAQYDRLVADSRAGAFILPADVSAGGRPCLRSDNPARDFALAVELIVPRARPNPGIAPDAHVAADAEVDESASIGPGASVGARTRVGARSVVHANVSLYADVVIGRDCELHASVVVLEDSQIGDRVILQPAVVIGGDGFGYVPGPDGRPRRVPHVGRVVIEDDVEIGANSTVDRATLGETRIRRGAKIDNLVQIAHNCDIGENAIIVAQTGLAGSTRVGTGAIMMAQSGSAGHLSVGDGAFVAARAGLHKDVPAGVRVYGAPQMEARGWHRSMAVFSRLPALLRRVRAIERVLGLRPGAKESSGATAGPDREGEP
jgi:UDP-3-O-[3-hydroxymyristoyl] glucosamine N-acyltransferase